MELVVIIILIGVLATVATREMTPSIETAKVEQTKKELDQLAFAVVGNPALYTNGARANFGYVGDVGALPPDVNALAVNPGSFTTWDGPYIDAGAEGSGHLTDAWGANYQLIDTVVRSVGSGTNIDKLFAGSSAELLNNTVSGFIVDANSQPPGTAYTDSITLLITCPDGSGGTTNLTTTPAPDGLFTVANIPIGNHTVTIIYHPDSDTVKYPVSILPGRTSKLDIIFPADLW